MATQENEIMDKLKDMIVKVLRNSKEPGFRFLANYVNFDIECISPAGVNLKTSEVLNNTIINFWCDKIDKEINGDTIIYRRSNETLYWSASIVWSNNSRIARMIKFACFECFDRLIEKLELTNEDYEYLCKIDNPKVIKEVIRLKKITKNKV